MEVLAQPISTSNIDCTMKTCSIKMNARLKKQLQCFHRGIVVVKKKKKFITNFFFISFFFLWYHQVWLLMDSLMQVGLNKASI